MSLSRQNIITELSKVLAALYEEPASAKRVAEDADIDTTSISLQSSPINNWRAILRQAQNQSRLTSLVDLAMAEYPASPLLEEIYNIYYVLLKEDGQIWASNRVLSVPLPWNKEDIERYRAHMRTLCSTTRILGKSEPISLEGIYTDVYLLDKLTARQRFSIEELQQRFQQRFDSTLPKQRFQQRFDSTLQKQRFQQRFDSTLLKRWNGLELVRQSHNLFILGKPGAGKTTLLRYIALQAAQQRLDKLPIFVTLKEWQPNQQGVMSLILKHFVQCGFPDALAFVEQQLREGKAILLFDGLDEVNQEHDQQRQLIQQLTEVSERYPKCQCLITCRLAATDYQFPRFQDVEVADFTENQIHTYVRNWFRGNEKKGDAFFIEFNKPDHQGLRELASIPLLLSLLCLVFEEGMAFPLRRSELYKEALDVLLKKWDTSRNIRRDTIYQGLSTELKQQLFAAIAIETFDRGEYFFPEEFLKGRIETYIARLPPIDRASEIDGMQILHTIEAHHSILVERARGIYSFSHLTLQEYFTAKYVVDHSDRDTIAKLLTANHVTDDRWREALLLTASLLPSADNFSHQFEQIINGLIAEDVGLVALLRWAQDKVASVETPYQRSALRSYYIYLALDLDRGRDLALDLDRALDRGCDLALDLARTLDRTLASALDLARARSLALDRALALDFDFAVALDFALARTLALTRTLDRALDLDRSRSRSRSRDLDRALTLDLDLALDRARSLALDRARDRDRDRALSLLEFHEALAVLQLPAQGASSEEWKSFAEELHAIMIKHRKIGHKWNLSQEQLVTLNTYLEASQLFVNCLDVAVVSNRQALKDSLLLPPSNLGSQDSR